MPTEIWTREIKDCFGERIQGPPRYCGCCEESPTSILLSLHTTHQISWYRGFFIDMTPEYIASDQTSPIIIPELTEPTPQRNQDKRGIMKIKDLDLTFAMTTHPAHTLLAYRYLRIYECLHYQIVEYSDDLDGRLFDPSKRVSIRQSSDKDLGPLFELCKTLLGFEEQISREHLLTILNTPQEALYSAIAEVSSIFEMENRRRSRGALNAISHL